MPDPSPTAARLPHVGDRVVHQDRTLVLTVEEVGTRIFWRVDRGGEKPLRWHDTPAEFARTLARTLATGATFIPAPDPPFPPFPPVQKSSAPSA